MLDGAAASEAGEQRSRNGNHEENDNSGCVDVDIISAEDLLEAGGIHQDPSGQAHSNQRENLNKYNTVWTLQTGCETKHKLVGFLTYAYD